MEKINQLVGYNNLVIYQNDDWFKFSLESVLLPSFVVINKNVERILDLCSGNAPIPLILSIKTKKKIIGVEIQKDIYDLAVKSVKDNHLEHQIEMINDDLNNLFSLYESDSFDIITCNPPYFKNIETSKKNADIHKIIARHEIKTNLEQIIKLSKKLLKNGGKLYLVHRTDRFFEVSDLLKKNNLMPKRIKFIYPKEQEESNLFMIEAVKDGKYGLKILSPLFVHNEDGTYRDEIKRMFKME